MKIISKNRNYNAWSNGRGHPIGCWRNKWYYIDTGEPYDDSRACIKCDLFATEEGHDPCIAYIDGVRNACCGHGVEDGYVQFENGLVLRGQFDHIKYPHLYKNESV